MNNASQPVYFQELYEYSKNEIFNKFNECCDETNPEELNEDIVNKLLKHDFIKYDDENDKYRFKFVGILIIDNMVIFSYPKYINNENNIGSDFKEVIKVLKKYRKSKKGKLNYKNEENEGISFNLLSLMIYILEDYYENGVYTKVQNILKINGRGEINWDKTINDTYPIIDDGRPYYIELYTRSKIYDLFDYFKLLHEYIITECAKYLKSVGLLEIFDLTYVELSDKSREDFGEDDYILKKLEKEMHVEYDTHKQELLRVMYIYISQKNIFTNRNFLTLYGTKTYHTIWEEMCSNIFSNKLEFNLVGLKLNKPLNGKYAYYGNIYDIIEYPKWILNGEKPMKSQGKLEPDIITFHKDNFIILDAKYYDLIFEKDKDLKGNPGISDITKQYLYQLALDDFRKEHGYLCVKNALLFPKYDGEIENKGKVKLDMFSKFNLVDIQVVMLPADWVNEKYLANETVDISSLKLGECRLIKKKNHCSVNSRQKLNKMK